MDLKLLLAYIGSHYGVVLGTLVASILTTCMILLIRAIGEKHDAHEAGGGAVIDVDVLEGAMKRVLAAQPVMIAAGSGSASAAGQTTSTEGADPAIISHIQSLQTAVEERDAKLTDLAMKLEEAKAAASAASVGDGGSADPNEVAELKDKLDELQARLSEYEIIEDDIADLSMFKDENVRMKDEIAKLKMELAQGGGAAAAAAAAAPAPAPASLAGEIAGTAATAANAEAEAALAELAEMASATQETSAGTEVDPPEALVKEMATPVAPVAVAAAAPTPEPLAAPNNVLKFEKVDRFELDPNDSAVMEFAAAFEAQMPTLPPDPAPNILEATQGAVDAMLASSPPSDDPMNGTPNTEKMLSEVEQIATPTADAADGRDALTESLDTEKLLAEVDSLKAMMPKTSAEEEDMFAQFGKAQGD